MTKLFLILLSLVPAVAMAEDGQGGWQKPAAYFIAVALAAYGGTAAQSRAASTALEGIARNPSASDKIMTPMILCLALMESLVIFTLITVFLI